MAALTTQQLGTGGAYTLAAAAGGGDTIERSVGGAGWVEPIVLIVSVGATPTTVTLDGTAGSSLTSQTAMYLVPPGVRGTRANITYNQVTAVTVGAVALGSVNPTASFGT